MKVTLRQNYSWHTISVEPNEQTYNPEFVTEMPYKDVLEILRVQVEMEALQQRLQPIYQEAEARAKAAAEAKAAEKAELERIEAEGENLPV